MNCESLVNTGLSVPVLGIAALAALLLLAGVLIAGVRRGRRGVVAACVLLLVVGVSGLAPVATQSAQAASVDCTTPIPVNSLTIVQTSVLAGLTPWMAPLPIEGTVTNHSADETYITAIEVSIVGVRLASDAAAGTCDASDFLLLDAWMPVGETIAPGGTTSFAGASIGFLDKPTNQDACKLATVLLSYVTAD